MAGELIELAGDLMQSEAGVMGAMDSAIATYNLTRDMGGAAGKFADGVVSAGQKILNPIVENVSRVVDAAATSRANNLIDKINNPLPKKSTKRAGAANPNKFKKSEIVEAFGGDEEFIQYAIDSGYTNNKIKKTAPHIKSEQINKVKSKQASVDLPASKVGSAAAVHAPGGAQPLPVKNTPPTAPVVKRTKRPPATSAKRQGTPQPVNNNIEIAQNSKGRYYNTQNGRFVSQDFVEQWNGKHSVAQQVPKNTTTQVNDVVEAATKKAASETTEKITKEVADETIEQAAKQSTKKVGGDIIDVLKKNKVGKMALGALALGYVASQISSNKGQQSNAQLYGQQRGYY